LLRISPDKAHYVQRLEVSSSVHQASYELNRITLNEVLPQLQCLVDLKWGATFFRPEVGRHLCHFRHLRCLEIGLPSNGIPESFAIWQTVIATNEIEQFAVYRQSLFVNLDEVSRYIDRREFLLQLLQPLRKSAKHLDLSGDAPSFSGATFSTLSTFTNLRSLCLPTDKPVWHDIESYTHIELEAFLESMDGEALESLSILESTPHLIRPSTLLSLAKRCLRLDTLRVRVDLRSDASMGDALLRVISGPTRVFSVLELGGTGAHWGDPGQERREHGAIEGWLDAENHGSFLRTSDLLQAVLDNRTVFGPKVPLRSLTLPTATGQADAILIAQCLSNLTSFTLLLERRADLHDTIPALSELEALGQLRVILTRPFAGDERDLEIELIYMLFSCLELKGSGKSQCLSGWRALRRIELLTARRGLEHGLVERRFWRVFEITELARRHEAGQSQLSWRYLVKTTTSKEARYTAVKSRSWAVDIQSQAEDQPLSLSLRDLAEDNLMIGQSFWSQDKSKYYWADGFL